MFNFKKLKVIKPAIDDSNNSFVGIRRGYSKNLEFTLPKGFDDFPDTDFNETKKLFFRMYKTFKKFDGNISNKELDKKSNSKDNIETDGKAYSFKDSEDNDVIIYSKISLIEKMLEAYQDLSMDFIEQSVGKTDQINYKNIDHYLDKAIYLDNEAIFIDEIYSTRYTICHESNRLITLFCFIIRELYKELGNFIDSRVNEIADFFVAYNLSPDQSLFEETSFDSTVATLKDVLHEIDKTTAYKDSRYWQLFEAIECFLYGELNMENIYDDGIFWGINNFFQIWEDMCNTYAFENFSVLFADTNIVYNKNPVGNFSLGHHKIYKKEDIDYPFYIEFREHKRWMRPDLVYISNINYDSPLSNYIKIKREDPIAGRVRFNVRCISKDKKKSFDTFCKKLENRNKKGGSRKINEKNGSVSFTNYPVSLLDEIENDLFSNKNSKESVIHLIDWKYMKLSDFQKGNPKVKSDVTKQLCYEFCLSKLKDNSKVKFEKIESVFGIPKFDKSIDRNFHEVLDDKNIDPIIKENGIKLMYFNFYTIQDAYIKND